MRITLSILRRQLCTVMIAPVVLSLVLTFSGCTTQPVVIQPPQYTKPALCLKKAAPHLNPLPDDFLGFAAQSQKLPAAEAAEILTAQAREILTMHGADNTLYESVLAQLFVCQQFVEGLP